MMSLAKHFLWAVTMLLVSLPLVNDIYRILPRMPLNGSYANAAEPEFSWSTWLDGSYQSAAEPWLNESVSCRDLLVRLRNQYYFTVFDQAKANAVIALNDGVLVEQAYLDALYGDDFAGEDFLLDKLKRWKRVQKGLDSIGVKAVLAFAPGKGSYYEHLIPEHLQSTHKPFTNYSFIKQWGAENQLNMLDLKGAFHAWSDTSRYPLFAKGGIHWNEYGVVKACDSIRGYLQWITGRPLRKFWYSIEVSDTVRGGDNDIANGMNLLFTPKEEKLAYPFRYFGEDSTIAPTRLLTIADSYYYGIIYSGFANRICSFGGFFYYFQETYPSERFASGNVSELDLLSVLKEQDVVMLMMTEPQLKRFGWGSVEKLEEVMYPPK